jgi:hypothetical protein
VASSRSPCGRGKFALCRLSEFRNSAPVIAVDPPRGAAGRPRARTVDPSVADWAFDEELGVIRWQGPVSRPEIFAPPYFDHGGS